MWTYQYYVTTVLDLMVMVMVGVGGGWFTVTGEHGVGACQP